MLHGILVVFLLWTWELSLFQRCDFGCPMSLRCLPRDLDVVSIASPRAFAVGHVSYGLLRELVSPSCGWTLSSFTDSIGDVVWSSEQLLCGAN